MNEILTLASQSTQFNTYWTMKVKQNHLVKYGARIKWTHLFSENVDEHGGVILIIVYVLSSPYLLVFGDDRVIRYTEGNDITSGAGEA